MGETAITITLLPLQPVDHVSHQGIGDAGEGLLGHKDGLPQLIQDHGVPVHLLLPCLELEGEIVKRPRVNFRCQKLLNKRLNQESDGGKLNGRPICSLPQLTQERLLWPGSVNKASLECLLSVEREERDIRTRIVQGNFLKK